MPATRTILTGLFYGEAPRWHDGEVWCSDMHGHAVVRSTLDGRSATVAALPDDRPSGLGWLPDGRLLIVAMGAQHLLRVEPGGELVVHADLSAVARGLLNDMVVAPDGTAYIGDMAFDPFAADAEQTGPGQTIRVTPSGDVSAVSDHLELPNGYALSDDGRMLVVAESTASRLTAYDVLSDGTLANGRTFADLEPAHDGVAMAMPDGICLDADGAVWVADVVGARLIRVIDGGDVVDTIQFDDAVPVACVLGGDDRRTLLYCVVDAMPADLKFHERNGRIDARTVTVPGAGTP